MRSTPLFRAETRRRGLSDHLTSLLLYVSSKPWTIVAWVVVLALIVPHVITSSYTYVESRVLYRLRDHKTHFEQVPYEQKQDLFMSYVNRNVFEIGVDRVPVLQPLFRQFEKQKRLIVKGAKMSDFDKSCRKYYEDSLSMSGDFDRAFYAEVEASKERNGMNECKFDGEVGDIEGWLKKHKFWGKDTKQNPLLRKLALGINMPEADGKPLERLYGEVMESLGFVEEAGSVDSVFGRTSFEGVKHVKNFSYLPPDGFLQWHTNKADNNLVSFRLYMIAVDKDGGSYLNYYSEGSREVRRVPDFNGAVRIFTNTIKDKGTAEVPNLWHTVVSETAHRMSVGFEIPVEQIIALLDSCKGCWREILYENLQHEKRKKELMGG